MIEPINTPDENYLMCFRKNDSERYCMPHLSSFKNWRFFRLKEDHNVVIGFGGPVKDAAHQTQCMRVIHLTRPGKDASAYGSASISPQKFWELQGQHLLSQLKDG